jgi:hypothetical protein
VTFAAFMIAVTIVVVPVLGGRRSREGKCSHCSANKEEFDEGRGFHAEDFFWE